MQNIYAIINTKTGALIACDGGDVFVSLDKKKLKKILRFVKKITKEAEIKKVEISIKK